MNKIEKISNKIFASFDNDDKINALSQFLFGTQYFQNLNANNIIIEIDDNTFKVGQKQYLVLTNDQADQIAFENIKSTIKQCGVNSINGFECFIKKDFFNKMMKDYYQEYAYDIYDEQDNEYGNRLVQECYEAELIDDDDFDEDEQGQINFNFCKLDRFQLSEKLTNYLCEQQSSVDWILQYYGYYPLQSHRNKLNLYDDYPNCFDLESCVNYVISSDGRGLQIASYDGKEDEINYNGEYFYIYRIN